MPSVRIKVLRVVYPCPFRALPRILGRPERAIEVSHEADHEIIECAYIDDTRINGPNHVEFGVRRHQRRCVSGIRGHPRRRILMRLSNHMSFLLISKLKRPCPAWQSVFCHPLVRSPEQRMHHLRIFSELRTGFRVWTYRLNSFDQADIRSCII
jgi:hypothetical protein